MEIPDDDQHRSNNPPAYQFSMIIEQAYSNLSNSPILFKMAFYIH